MTKFYIEDSQNKVEVVDKRKFMETLNGLKELWSEEYKTDIYENVANWTITKMWYFQWTRMWIIADDYKELEELGL